MYGFVHVALVDWLNTRPNGEEEIAEIVRRAGDADTSISFYKHYSDQDTFAILGVTSEVLNLPIPEVLHQIGDYQLDSLLEKGFGPLVRTLGATFFEMLSNLDSFHVNLSKGFPKMKGPSFRPERTGKNTVMLHYHSAREGVAPYAMALLHSLAKRVWQVKMEMEHYAKKGEEADHDIFLLTLEPKAFGEDEASIANQVRLYGPPTSEDVTPASVKVNLSTALMEKAFPWHFAVDRSGKLISAGSRLVRRFPANEGFVGRTFMETMKVVRPTHVQPDFAQLEKIVHSDTLIVVRDAHYVRRRRFESDDSACPMHDRRRRSSALDSEHIMRLQRDLILRGELVYSKEHDALIFLGIPSISDAEDIDYLNVRREDMPVHSNGHELIFSIAHQSASMKMTEDMTAVMENLDETMKELAVTKQRTDELLHSLLPKSVAEKLAQGIKPQPEKYDNVSILFSDIVGFTNISSMAHPTEVMDMLNHLFSLFDKLVEKHGVYKLETIGDAYVVVCGLPEREQGHADKLAAFALDMVKTASTVCAPQDGTPLRLRVGVHSGPVVAGLVGTTGARYCLFGDSMNTASRMESTSVPGSIQMSSAFRASLMDHKKFWTTPRGKINVKGKGEMHTFFLEGYAEDKTQISDATRQARARAMTTDSVASSEAVASEAASTAGDSGNDDGPATRAPSADSAALNSAIPAAPSNRAAAVEATRPAPTALYTVHVVKPTSGGAPQQCPVVTLDFVPATATLQEVLATALSPPEASEARLYSDKARSRLLMLSAAIGDIAPGLLGSQKQSAGSSNLVMYAGGLSLGSVSTKGKAIADRLAGLNAMSAVC